MKVALVVPVFPQVSETFIVAKALGLLDRGVDVHLVCSASPRANWVGYGEAHRVHELRERVHVSPSTSPRPSALASSLRSVAGLAAAPGEAWSYLRRDHAPMARRLRDLVIDSALLSLAPDIVHFEFGSLATGRMELGERLGAAVTVSFRGYDLNYVGLDEPGHYSGVWKHADGIHVLGADLWRRAVHRGAPPSLPHTIITPAIDTSRITGMPARPGVLGGERTTLRVLSVGRLHWKKGYDHALEAVASLQALGVQVEYRIVGDGEMLAAVAFWRHQLGLDDSVELLGAVPPVEVARQLEWADVFLHAATSEGFCNAVIEAQAHGVPVVCSDADGLPENVEHGATGIVVPRRDPSALADAVALLAGDGEQRMRMSAAGRRRVDRLFRIEDQVDAWIRFYEDALQHRLSIAA